MPDSPDLRKVRRAADKAALARTALHDAIRELHADGVSLRGIAALTGLSHETVRKIVA